MIRNLLFLRKNNLINNELKILDNNLFFVFNGDAIDRSPFSIDSLILYSLLMIKNPKKVIYVAGNHESQGGWLDYNLRRELLYRAWYQSKQSVPFKKQILNFFSSLPRAVYVSAPKERHELIRISFMDENKLGHKKTNLCAKIVGSKDYVNRLIVNENEPEKDCDIRAIFTTQPWRKFNRIKKGLALLDQEGGATKWAVLSSPIPTHKKFLNFYFDAFVALNIDETITQSSVTLYHQDVRLLRGYTRERPKNVIVGGPAIADIDIDDVSIGSSISLERGLPTMGQQIKSGIDLAVNRFNIRQAGNPFCRLYIKNDNYIPKKARMNIAELLGEGVKLFLMPLGTPTLTNSLDLIKRHNAGVFFPQSGSSILRKPYLKKLVHFRASYEDEARALVDVLVKEYGSLRFALFYQDDSFGQGPFRAALKKLKALGIKEILALPYTRGSIDYDRQVEKLKRFSPDAIGFFLLPVQRENL